MSDKKRNDRTRNWTFVIYPESAPDNWRDILDEDHIQWVESPVHDRDVTGAGEVKKAHIHVLLAYDGPKSFEQVKELTDKINCPIPQKCASARSLVRYMAHLDDPNKAQYDKSLIIGHGGIDVDEMLKPRSAVRYSCIKEMIDYVIKADVVEFLDLVDYAMTNRYEDWFPLLCDNSAFILDKVIKSNRYRSRTDDEDEQYLLPICDGFHSLGDSHGEV